MVCICGHSAIVHHIHDLCSLCIEDGFEWGCGMYVEKIITFDNIYFKICDKCNETFPELTSRCDRCGNENLRKEPMPK